MKRDKLIYLISHTEEENGMGDSIPVEKKRKRFADEKSINQSEVYQAHTAGLKPVITFVIFPFEYKGENKIEYNGTIYRVIRTYKKNSTDFEIVCEGDLHGDT
ncbi:MAG: phage head closure protein [Clostridium sp.]